MQLGNYQLSDLEYADDTMLFCELITIRNLLLISIAKKLLSWVSESIGQKHVRDDPDPPIKVDGVEAEFVKSFSYLRSITANTTDLHEEINRHRFLATVALNSLS